MKPGVLITVIVVGLALTCGGCAESARERLIGTWQSQTQPPSDAAGAGMQLARSALSLASVRLELHPDGTGTRSSSLLGGSAVESGRWRVAEAEGGHATLELSADGFQTYERWRIEFLDDDRFSTTLPGLGVELVFARSNNRG